VTVVKVLELVGDSPKSWQDAAENACVEAARTVDQIKAVEVTNMTASVEDGKIVEYKANIKVAFVVDGDR